MYLNKSELKCIIKIGIVLLEKETLFLINALTKFFSFLEPLFFIFF